MLKNTLLLLFTLFTCTAFAQLKVEGIVLSSIDKKPVSNASVYINNTSTGTSTDESGNFSLTVHSLTAELVVSHLSFEKQTLKIDGGQSGGKLTILLRPKTDMMEHVTVGVKNKETWKKWGKLFTACFTGELEFSKQCTILNPEAILFSYNKKKQVLIARAKKTLLVENRALGYIVHFDMDSFSYSFPDSRILRSGSSFFEPIAAKDSAELAMYASNRIYAYKGSKMHFMRSIFNRELTRQGFTVYIFRARKNGEKERLQRMLSMKEAKNYEQGQQGGPIKLTELTSDRDSLLYYTDIMASPSYIFYDSVKLEMDTRILGDKTDEIRALQFSGDTLLVRYQDTIDAAVKAPDVKRAKNYKRLPQELKVNYNFFRNYKPSLYQFTMLYLLDGDYLTIEKNGYYREIDYLFEDGYMAWKKVAYLLPWDYDPRGDAWADE